MQKTKYLLCGLWLVLWLAVPAMAQKSKTKPAAKPTTKPVVKTPVKSRVITTAPVQKAESTKSAVATLALSPEKLEKYHARIRELIENMEAQYNILGSTDYDLSDKSTVINESFGDIYRDDKVQIEDDLVEGRSTAYNKNIKSYLQDIVTFFGEAKFVLELAKIDPPIVTEDGHTSFKVTLNRNLTATTKNGQSINRTVKRFVEINIVDQAKDELKVVSVYTTGAGGVVGLQFWWAGLPPEWKTLGMGAMAIPDTVATEEQLKQWTEVSALSLRDRPTLSDLTPLAAFKNIRQLDISNTGVENIGPVRDLIRLVVLNATGTKILAIDALNFLVSLTEVNLDGTKITSIKPLTNLVNLEKVSLQNTLVRDLAPLAGAAKLRHLALAGSPAESVGPLSNLRGLQTLDLSSSKVTNLAPLSNLGALLELVLDNTDVKSVASLQSLTALQVLSLNGSAVANLAGLGKMPALKTIYADNTDIKRSAAQAHLLANPASLVVFETAALKKWWKDCPENWKVLFQKSNKFSGDPTKEQLAQLANLTEIDLEGQAAINTLAPLQALPELRSVRAANTTVVDLVPLARLAHLKTLNLDNTKVTDLKPLAALAELEELRVAGTPLNSFAGLEKLAKLKLVYADEAAVSRNSKAVIEFIEILPQCLLIYKTDVLQKWWKGLSPDWQQVFGQYEKFADPKTPSTEGLHHLALLKSLEINQPRINSLQPGTILYRLESLSFTNTQISDLTPVASFSRLITLRCPKNPIGDLSPIGGMQSLRFLDCENTAIDNLESLAGLTKLKELHFSGTQVKKLKGLESMTGLETLEFYSTAVNSLKSLEGLPKLKLIKCYNTKLSKGDISGFKKAQPKCEVIHY